ncbi:MAG: hypothetical protein NZ528_02840 [Caldilineales bacterium]|nr:hypothetical protein [Caldilineales bacterium]MDW8316335.1 hypothetical protein [Anaerolineae bacterium]
MPDLGTALLLFAAVIVGLYLVQRWSNRYVQAVGLLLFGSRNAGLALLWLVLLPGTLLHELSHWAMAKALGLRTGRFRIWPEFKRDGVVLGSVEVQRTNALADSLVGLAPFIGGTLALLAIGYLVFDVAAMAQAWNMGAWRQLWWLVRQAPLVPDAWLWLYLSVAISNAMMPSPTDRASWRPVLTYTGLVAVVALAVGGVPALPSSWVAAMAGGLQMLTAAFAFTLAVDLVFAVALAGTVWLLSLLRGQRVEFR